MKLSLKRIAPIQAGKILAAFYALMSLLIVPFMLLFMALGSFAARQQAGVAAPPLPLMFGMGVGFVVFLPLLYAAFGFVGGVIGAAIYNQLARWLGGLELEFEGSVSQPPPIAGETRS